MAGCVRLTDECTAYLMRGQDARLQIFHAPSCDFTSLKDAFLRASGFRVLILPCHSI